MNALTQQAINEGIAGIVERRRARLTGSIVSIYRADEAGISSDFAYVTVCEDHGTMIGHETLAGARYHLPAVEWCEECQEAIGERS